MGPEQLNWDYKPCSSSICPTLQEQLERAEKETAKPHNFSSATSSYFDFFYYSFLQKEAVLSSNIEGNTRTIKDVFMVKAGLLNLEGEEKNEIVSVSNYYKAFHHGLQILSNKGEYSLDLLHCLHKILMSEEHDSKFTAGDFRRKQVAVGTPKLFWVPPTCEKLPELMDNLLSFANHSNDLPPLVRAGITHGQFETIHPYEDGNGRLGRILLSLQLNESDEEQVKHMLLHPSYTFKAFRQFYFRGLQTIRDQQIWEKWLWCFLDLVALSAQEATILWNNLDALVTNDTGSVYCKSGEKGVRLLQALIECPYVTVERIAALCGISDPQAEQLLRQFEEVGVLHQEGEGVFVYQRFLDMCMSEADPNLLLTNEEFLNW
eukprot:CAMPEP_0174252678 /NCGR_PEP_ID=MMETSP0439-20130205/2048_1 /TAXON_ID=0 /ORGANISM="Stereomyxa ramosa, Strain Chinc5" /LENGTH=375 /DNA_ID=CAMNT_0015333251 /DNA_START=272 /DNA_END=1399 /DNA_ORIENTATION=+